MPDAPAYPTPHLAVNAVLSALSADVQAILGQHVVGMYLGGSLAAGDFDPQRSDIDFVVVTADELTQRVIAELAAMHARLAAGSSKWGAELEGSYFPRRALRRYDPAHARYPHIERGGGLSVEQHESDWVIQCHILREKGVAIAGPAPRTLIDPIGPGDLRQAVLGILRAWWAPMLHDPAHLHSCGYRTYAILTMCRMLYTLHYGLIVSKPVAARWARETLDGKRAALIDWAWAGWPDAEPGNLNETLDFIRYTLERSRHFEALAAPV